ncbi:hypothetical protein DL96DRAFT_1650648 [Flagelloscypha sp. PMI_526]|nr:hypothetical protein DL96DRAFT_1650648 [Flagelloscypha sp. PMI_526]
MSRLRSYSLSTLDHNGIPASALSSYLMALVPSSLALARTSAASIKQFPNELFVEILSYLVDYIDIVAGIFPIFAFAQVCRHWRQLAFQTKFLWTQLQFSSIPLEILDPDGFPSKEHLNNTFDPLASLLELSANQRLNVVFDWADGTEYQWNLETFSTIFGPLLDQAWRWESLVIPEYMLCFLKELNIKMPLLTSFSISLNCPFGGKTMSSSPSLPVETSLSVLQGSPSLEHADLLSCRIDAITFPTRSLQTLHVRTLLAPLFTENGSWAKLTHLTLTSPFGIPLGVQGLLPELLRLDLIDCHDPNATRIIFESLRCPKLEHLQVEFVVMFPSDFSALEYMLNDSDITLRKLVLHQCSFMDSDLSEFLSNCERIESLVIEDSLRAVRTHKTRFHFEYEDPETVVPDIIVVDPTLTSMSFT